LGFLVKVRWLFICRSGRHFSESNNRINKFTNLELPFYRQRKITTMADKKKLLYVDDEVANLNVFRIAFKRRYDITTAGSAEEGLEILATDKFDVLVADHRMPGMTGVEMMSQVSEKYPTMTRILISEYVNDEIIRRAITSYDLDGSIGKPWDADKLIAMIEK